MDCYFDKWDNALLLQFLFADKLCDIVDKMTEGLGLRQVYGGTKEVNKLKTDLMVSSIAWWCTHAISSFYSLRFFDIFQNQSLKLKLKESWNQ